jgi:glycosyltransferase involved in cell wall biosynthesis
MASDKSLSVCIPARNEEYLSLTIDDILRNAEGETDVIVTLDGYWPDPPLIDHPKVTLIHHTEPVGQRAGTNEAVRLSKAKYIMKADGHCAFDKGFDVKLMADCEYNWTVIPLMKNLHIFNWKCMKCGRNQYQGPQPKECPDCKHTDLRRRKVWKPRRGTSTTQMLFDSNLHFQYWMQRRPEGDIVDTMSFIGAAWFMHKDYYWDLEGLDEATGTWGQVGTEIACKTWLSGGRLCVNKKTWFAHFFRTQFGWPYHISGRQVDRARAYSNDFWKNNKWPKQKYPLHWLVERFWPVPGWTEEELQKLKSNGGGK